MLVTELGADPSRLGLLLNSFFFFGGVVLVLVFFRGDDSYSSVWVVLHLKSTHPNSCFLVAAAGSLLGDCCAELTVVMKSFTWWHAVESTGTMGDG